MYISNTSLVQLMSAINNADIFLEEEEQQQTPVQKDDISQYNHHPYRLECDLLDALASQDYKKFEQTLEELKNYSPAILCHNDKIRSVKNNIICNCTIFTRIALKLGVDETLAFKLSDTYINKVEDLNTIDDLVHLNTTMIVVFMSHAQHTAKKQFYSSTTCKVIDYIDTNLYNSLTLEDAANALHINASYISRVFKKDTGQTFNKYIHMQRIQKAKQLLLSTNRSLVEISESLGYSNQSHFNRVFKTETGVTPYQYKKQSLLNDTSSFDNINIV